MEAELFGLVRGVKNDRQQGGSKAEEEGAAGRAVEGKGVARTKEHFTVEETCRCRRNWRYNKTLPPSSTSHSYML